MKILLDENLPHRLRFALTEFEVVTATFMGWSGVKNGKLLALAEAAAFNILLTADQNLDRQQNLRERPIAVIGLTALHWELIEPHIGAIRTAIKAADPGSFQLVNCGRFTRS